MRNSLLLFITILLISACSGVKKPQQSVSQQSARDVYAEKGMVALKARNYSKSIKDFKLAAAICDKEAAQRQDKIYEARSLTETIYYMALSSAKKETASVIANNCAEIFYLTGFVSMDMGQPEQAKLYINKSIALSPSNAMYLSELGHVYQIESRWDTALATFKRAEAAAQLSPKDVQIAETTRAKRGMAYALIELGKMDEAKAKLNECLELNPNDEKAMNELTYIEEQMAGKKNAN